MPKVTPQSASTLINVFKRFGCTLSKRNSGDHIAMRKEGLPRPIIFPDQRNVPVFIILNCLKTCGVSRDEYFRVLNDL